MEIIELDARRKHREIPRHDMNRVAREIYYAVMGVVQDLVTDRGLCDACYSPAVVNSLADVIATHLLERKDGLSDCCAETNIVAHRILERLCWHCDNIGAPPDEGEDMPEGFSPIPIIEQ